jgi:hypothetical protein
LLFTNNQIFSIFFLIHLLNLLIRNSVSNLPPIRHNFLMAPYALSRKLSQTQGMLDTARNTLSRLTIAFPKLQQPRSRKV